jgi:uncharacterized membrane protein YdbT with pleckstrin-like domain
MSYTFIMPPKQNNPSAPQPPQPKHAPDKNGYYRLGKTTLYYLLFKYGFPAIVLFFIELILLGAAVGGNGLPPFSEWVSTYATFATVVRAAASIVPPLIFAAIAFALVMGYGYYWSFRYKLDDNDLAFEKGLIGREEISIPFRQIQNVDIEQSFIYRIFNLADLVILTAGHEDQTHIMKDESEIIMPALNNQEARQLQRYLLDRANIQRSVVINASVEPAVPPPLE